VLGGRGQKDETKDSRVRGWRLGVAVRVRVRIRVPNPSQKQCAQKTAVLYSYASVFMCACVHASGRSFCLLVAKLKEKFSFFIFG
jgi:hypothetical protein